MKISSPAIKEAIPKKYTCDGQDAVPPLAFEEIPAGTASLVLVVDDPDAPRGTWDHWLLYNIPPGAKGVEEGKEPPFPHGLNSWKREEWGGPCPPDKQHAYVFTLYALDAKLSFPQPPFKKELLEAIEGHVLEKAVLKASYKRPWM